MAQSPCFLSPLANPFCSPFWLLSTYLETLLAVTGSVHLGLRLLVNWPPLLNSFSNPSPLQIPSTQVIKRLTMTTSRLRRLLSRLVSNAGNQNCMILKLLKWLITYFLYTISSTMLKQLTCGLTMPTTDYNDHFDQRPDHLKWVRISWDLLFSHEVLKT